MGNHGMTLFPLHLANKMLHHKWYSRGLVIASGPFRGAALTPRPPPWHWLSLPSIPPDTRSMCKMIGDSLVLGGTGFAYFPRGATWWNHSGRPRHERKSLMRYQKWQGVTTKLSRVFTELDISVFVQYATAACTRQWLESIKDGSGKLYVDILKRSCVTTLPPFDNSVCGGK